MSDGYGEITATSDGNFVKLEQIDPDSIIELIESNPKLKSALRPYFVQGGRDILEDREEARIERSNQRK